MKLNPKLKSWLGALLFLMSVLAGLALSAVVTWGQAEATLYTSFNGDTRVGIRCPLMLAPFETGRVRAMIANLTGEEIKPVVSAGISHIPGPRREDQTIVLGSGGSETVTWEVDASDVVFERLILVNILQSRYRDNPSMLGSCGILVFNLFGLTGLETLWLVVSASLAAMFSGGFIWVNSRRPLNLYSGNLVRVNTLLMIIIVLALLSMFLRWWGLTLVLDALSLLVMGVIFTDFVLFSQK